jgi:tRNA-specific 2-thiouridylase
VTSKPVVAVAMSGGVDSSVAAALLVERGFSVFGLMLRLWSEQDNEGVNRCCNPDSMAFARRVAAILSIPFYVIDARQFFYDTVITSFIHDYTHNLTPNPCITCNRLVRWEFMLNYALSAGANFLATGHYARISQNPDHSFSLLRGTDAKKDQSYVLHVLTQKQLAVTLFPLGDYTKNEVRHLAYAFNLPVAERPDSQDLCFIGANGDYRQFLAHHAPQSLSPGEIVDQQGNILGRHDGLAFFTIGQRKGMRVPSTKPMYVLDKDFSRNRLIVGIHDQTEMSHVIADKVNWIAGDPIGASFSALVKIRYKAADVPAEIDVMPENRIRMQLRNPVHDATPGQAAVLYNGDICLGGGIISSVSRIPN